MWKFLKETDSITNLERTRNLAIIGGAISGITVIWTVLYAQFSGALVGWSVGTFIAGTLATVLTALVVFVVDYGTKVDLPYALDLLFSGRAFQDVGKNWRVLLFAIILLSFNFARLGFTAAIDWYGRGDMISVVMQKPVESDIVAIKDSLSKATVATVATVEKDLRQLHRQLSQAERQVEKENPALLKNIMGKQDKWGWNARELRKRKDKATANIRKQIATKDALLMDRLSKESSTTDLIVASQQKKNEREQAEYREKKHRLSMGVGYFGVGCSLATLIISILLSLINSANQDNPYYHKKHEAKKVVGNPATTAADNTAAPAIVSTTAAPSLQAVPIRNDNRDSDEVLKKLIVAQAEKLSDLSIQILEIKNRPVEVVERVVEKPSTIPVQNVEKVSKPLSDNGSTKATVADSVEVVAVDTKNLRDATMKQWERSFTSKEEKTRLENKAKAEQGIKRLRELGFTVEVNGTKLSITSKN